MLPILALEELQLLGQEQIQRVLELRQQDLELPLELDQGLRQLVVQQEPQQQGLEVQITTLVLIIDRRRQMLEALVAPQDPHPEVAAEEAVRQKVVRQEEETIKK